MGNDRCQGRPCRNLSRAVKEPLNHPSKKPVSRRRLVVRGADCKRYANTQSLLDKEFAMKLDRRTFLRGAGVAMALPLLDVMARRASAATPAVKRRMVCINTPLGVHPEYFFPEKAGRDYELSPYLEVLKDFRDDFTVISGLSHPDVGPSHDSNYSFLTAAPHPEQRAGFRNSISLDQAQSLARERLVGRWQSRYCDLAI